MTLPNIDELIEKLNARAKRQADRGMSGLGYYGNGDAALDTQASAALSTLQEKRKLEEALREIVDPISAMQKRAEAEGSRLSDMAYSIAHDASYLQSIAQRALLSGGGE